MFMESLNLLKKIIKEKVLTQS